MVATVKDIDPVLLHIYLPPVKCVRCAAAPAVNPDSTKSYNRHPHQVKKFSRLIPGRPDFGGSLKADFLSKEFCAARADSKEKVTYFIAGAHGTPRQCLQVGRVRG